MIRVIALILFASTAWGQEASTDTLSVPVDTQIEISNLGKDTRSLLQGRYVQTGKPLFKNGFCVGTTATCQTTAASSRVYASSQTLDLLTLSAITATSGRPCVLGSTLTITTTAKSCIEYTVNTGWYSSAVGATAYYNLLINGERESSDDGGASSDSSYTGHDSTIINYGVSANQTFTTAGMVAGTYTMCLAVRTNTGTLTLPSIRHSKFYIREVDCP